MADVNSVVLIGRLTGEPELKENTPGQPILKLGLAVNGRQRNADGNWGDKPNFFDVTIFGAQAPTLARSLAKGSRIAVDGRLEWSSWEVQDGTKRSKVEVVANVIQYLDPKPTTAQEPGVPFP